MWRQIHHYGPPGLAFVAAWSLQTFFCVRADSAAAVPLTLALWGSAFVLLVWLFAIRLPCEPPRAVRQGAGLLIYFCVVIIVGLYCALGVQFLITGAMF